MTGKTGILLVTTIIMMTAIIVLYCRGFFQHWTGKWAAILVVSGGIGNMIDRFALGYVVDMIDFRLINFAVFNVADSFVCVGAGILVVYLLMSMWDEYKQEKAEKAAAAAVTTESDAAEEDHE